MTALSTLCVIVVAAVVVVACMVHEVLCDLWEPHA